MKLSTIDRFFRKVIWNGDDEECWEWQAAKDRHGYGHFFVNGKVELAHRVAYELLIGPIPEGKELDHVKERGCTSRACVNPAHLEPVTHGVNLARGRGAAMLGRIHGSKTHCKRGHPFDAANTYRRPGGGRQCQQCRRDRERAA